ncbi:MAG TPA: hypothetical protein VHS53_11570, partial [Mucilaginibacter sp.]|nr:hypothetical protein [Mucilaginibacter sp.]
MRKLLAILIFLTLCTAVSAQQKAIDSLKKQIVTAKDDTTHALLMCQLGSAYLYSKPDSSLLLAQQRLQLSKAAQFQKGEAIALTLQGNVYDVTGNYSKALSMLLESLKISE